MKLLLKFYKRFHIQYIYVNSRKNISLKLYTLLFRTTSRYAEKDSLQTTGNFSKDYYPWKNANDRDKFLHGKYLYLYQDILIQMTRNIFLFPQQVYYATILHPFVNITRGRGKSELSTWILFHKYNVEGHYYTYTILLVIPINTIDHSEVVYTQNQSVEGSDITKRQDVFTLNVYIR